MDALIRRYPGVTVGPIATRLRCLACGRGPGSVVLAATRHPDRRMALRVEEGRVECFWPVPLEEELAAPMQGQLAMVKRTPRRR